MASAKPLGDAAGQPGTSSYIPALDGLRALAFLFVFLAHTTSRTLAPYVPATFGVTVFFFLSGYLITTLLRGEYQKTGRISLRDFYIRRTLRIFIPMYCAYAFSAILSFTRLHAGIGNWRGFFSAIFYYYNYAAMVGPTPILPFGFDNIWSLGVEEHFYLLFPPLLLFLFRKRIASKKQLIFLLSICAFCLAWRIWLASHVSIGHWPYIHHWPYYATDCRLDSILWGSLLALWNNPRFDRPHPLLRRYSGLLATAALGVLIGTMASKSYVFREAIRYTVQGICLYAIFYFCISHIQHPTVHWLENKYLRYLGWLSYSLYLIHKTIAACVNQYIPPSDYLLASITLALSILYAVGIRYAVELPLQRVRARFRHAPPPIATGTRVEGI
jgi:peptidoglycan/LPS O-acetylase OafA/YrhL